MNLTRRFAIHNENSIIIGGHTITHYIVQPMVFRYNEKGPATTMKFEEGELTLSLLQEKKISIKIKVNWLFDFLFPKTTIKLNNKDVRVFTVPNQSTKILYSNIKIRDNVPHGTYYICYRVIVYGHGGRVSLDV